MMVRRTLAGAITGLLLAVPIAVPLAQAAEPSVALIDLPKPVLPELGGADDYLPFESLPLRLQISLSKRRVTVFQGDSAIKSYPVAVGKSGWETPVGQHKVLQMIHKPAWVSPFNGVVIPGGDPENPLGKHWIGFWTDGKNAIGFHGTPNPGSVGRAVSHGCVRMLNKDIEELFKLVQPGTVVEVVR